MAKIGRWDLIQDINTFREWRSPYLSFARRQRLGFGTAGTGEGSPILKKTATEGSPYYVQQHACAITCASSNLLLTGARLTTRSKADNCMEGAKKYRGTLSL